MKPKTATTLTIAAMLLLLVATAVGSPAGALAFSSLAVIFAAFPTLFGASGRTRIAAVITLVGALALSATMFPRYQAEMDRRTSIAR